MTATITMTEGVVRIPLTEPEVLDGAKYFDLGLKKSNRLPNGCFARSIHIFQSGRILLMESETISGRGSGYLFPAAGEVEISE